ncbi:putative tyrosine-protein phosphatase [Senna tora]|uniref:Putative tyrosine-protein phosphatase n=1 Tax=Senna tora TaxID=362788 RepID=A0A834WT23_9FABA|nr:putative tyrosine-protein phosphatase [Senna tora]
MATHIQDSSSCHDERRPRDSRKEKLAGPGKPDRKMPLSTIAKLNGGTKTPSPSTTPSSASTLSQSSSSTSSASAAGCGGSATSSRWIFFSLLLRCFWSF